MLGFESADITSVSAIAGAGPRTHVKYRCGPTTNTDRVKREVVRVDYRESAAVVTSIAPEHYG